MALFSAIAWSIPIPLKDYPLIAMIVEKFTGQEYIPFSHVKYQVFLHIKVYSLRVMMYFCAE
ncbi:hypothetical protein DBY68_021460 [Pseudocitrobacter sp. RIT415]|nr:hypothetical protein DBY68_021460 [Pseudocitrobacter sp. RIT 415]